MDVDNVLSNLRTELNRQAMGPDIGLLLDATTSRDFATLFPNFRWKSDQNQDAQQDTQQQFMYGRFTLTGTDPWKQYERMQTFMKCLYNIYPPGDGGQRGWKSGWYLVTMLAADAGERAEDRFKIYYLFSLGWDSDQQLFLMVEYSLVAQAMSGETHTGRVDAHLANALRNGEAYPSIAQYYRAAEKFEREIFDMFSLRAYVVSQAGSLTCDLKQGLLLFPDQYPPGLAPLRKDRRLSDLIMMINESPANPDLERHAPSLPLDAEGEYVTNLVGPTHGGIFAAGTTYLSVRRGRVADADIQLGYKHRGLEKFFEENCYLAPGQTTPERTIAGWELAAEVAKDSAFSHTLAYCHAAETLLGIQPPAGVVLLRGLFLEFERMVNHIGDCAALAQAISQDILFPEIMRLREYLMRLQDWLTGHRFMGVNRPGGIKISEAFHTQLAYVMQTSDKHEDYANMLADSIDAVVADISWKRLPFFTARKVNRRWRWLISGIYSLENLIRRFDRLSAMLLSMSNFRARAEGVGRLAIEDAEVYGTTGLLARASGLQRDMRIAHPSGVYRYHNEDWLKRAVQGIKETGETELARTDGDILSRVALRVREVDQSLKVVQAILQRLPEQLKSDYRTGSISRDGLFLGRSLASSDISQEAGTFAFGYVEGWRGDIVYAVMKGESNTIARCAIRDSSFLNFSAFPCIVRHDADADFPWIYKSCGLSIEGNDR